MKSTPKSLPKGLWENVNGPLIAHRHCNDWVMKAVALTYKIKFSRLHKNNFQRIYRFLKRFHTRKHFNILLSSVIFLYFSKFSFPTVRILYIRHSAFHTLVFLSLSYLHTYRKTVISIAYVKVWRKNWGADYGVRNAEWVVHNSRSRLGMGYLVFTRDLGLYKN